jgi:hypothetical protein
MRGVHLHLVTRGGRRLAVAKLAAGPGAGRLRRLLRRHACRPGRRAQVPNKA